VDELGRAEPRRFTAHDVLRRLARIDDPWAGMHSHTGSLERARAKLEELDER
jgi:DNA primase